MKKYGKFSHLLVSSADWPKYQMANTGIFMLFYFEYKRQVIIQANNNIITQYTILQVTDTHF